MIYGLFHSSRLVVQLQLFCDALHAAMQSLEREAHLFCRCFVQDMTKLSFLNEPNVLNNLDLRYQARIGMAFRPSQRQISRFAPDYC